MMISIILLSMFTIALTYLLFKEERRIGKCSHSFEKRDVQYIRGEHGEYDVFDVMDCKKCGKTVIKRT